MSIWFTRRKFLVGSALSVAGSVGVTVPLRPAAAGLTVLSPEERNVARAVAEVLFPGGPLGVRGDDPRVVERLDQILADTFDPLRRAGVRYVLRALQFGTIASRGARFTALSIEDRRDVLHAWLDPTVLARRVAADSLRAILAMAYFSLDDVLDRIGWRATCSNR
jgi:hypothetical protein